MTNKLNLRMRYNASGDLNTYAAEMSLTIKRDLKLELVKEEPGPLEVLKRRTAQINTY
jgi:hypothetical protein